MCTAGIVKLPINNALIFSWDTENLSDISINNQYVEIIRMWFKLSALFKLILIREKLTRNVKWKKKWKKALQGKFLLQRQLVSDWILNILWTTHGHLRMTEHCNKLIHFLKLYWYKTIPKSAIYLLDFNIPSTAWGHLRMIPPMASSCVPQHLHKYCLVNSLTTLLSSFQYKGFCSQASGHAYI